MFKFLVPSVLAQSGVPIKDNFPPANNFSNLGSLINVLLPNVLTIAGIIALVFTIISGFTFILHAGQGQSDKASKDKNAFTAAVVGLMIIFGAYIFLQIAGVIVGYDFLNPKL